MNGPARLAVRVRPGARSEGLDGRMADGTLKVKVRAPALEGRANQAVESLLAARLGVGRSQVRVARGLTTRFKSVEIDGLAPAELERRLAAALAAEEQEGSQRTRGS